MMSRDRLVRFAVLTGIVLLAAAARLVPHPPNVTPIAALALFGGAHFANRWVGLGVALVALLLGDLVIGFHALVPFVYGGFAAIGLLGFGLRSTRSVGRVAGATVAGSLLFFLITNFGMWWLFHTYPPTAAGLWACYVAGLPYLANSLAGNAVYVTVLFGGVALLKRAVPALRSAPASASA
ncbi:DUF6580 family putative transport protein [Salinibacter altiplanensis]|uniref:DUF6580 family putative transport protein n=1 Tax=Salinibacter altiplanensis TaxID=1803181 RepID=UPI000C9FAB59|nr:DUF6580 family putative transport protein [Salinibacter altiplanensis]